MNRTPRFLAVDSGSRALASFGAVEDRVPAPRGCAVAVKVTSTPERTVRLEAHPDRGSRCLGDSFENGAASKDVPVRNGWFNPGRPGGY